MTIFDLMTGFVAGAVVFLAGVLGYLAGFRRGRRRDWTVKERHSMDCRWTEDACIVECDCGEVAVLPPSVGEAELIRVLAEHVGGGEA